MTEFEKWSLLIGGLTFIASSVLAVLAIFGDCVRNYFARPSLSVVIRDKNGERKDGIRYYHLTVTNSRSWIPAKNVVVLLEKIERRGSGGSWYVDYATGPVQLEWQYSTFAGYGKAPVEIGRKRICDLGRVDNSQRFTLAIVQPGPHDFNSTLSRGEEMRVYLIAVADNAESKSLAIEMAWNDDVLTIR